MRRVTTGRLAAMVLAFALGGGVAAAELAAWDQARVTAIAKQLQKASEDLYTSVVEEPGMAPMDEAWYDTQQSVRLIQTECRHLAAELAAGKGQKQTLPSWRAIGEWVDDVKDDGPRSGFITEDVIARAKTVEGLLEQLRPFYDAKASSKPAP